MLQIKSRQGITNLGTKINPFTFHEAATLIDNMGSKYIDYEKLGIGIYALDNYHQAIIDLKHGRISKIIFDMNKLK